MLKTILRQIRRHYIVQFNQTTNYIKSKRGKGPEFFREQLKAFVTLLFRKDKSKTLKIKIAQYEVKTPGAKKGGVHGFIGELQILFGSIFYPKDMK